MNDIKFYFSDAWLLASILRASADAPADYYGIIVETDHINCAAITIEEFESGLARLIKSAWVTPIDGRFKISDTHIKRIKNLRNLPPRKDLMDAIKKELGVSLKYAPTDFSAPYLKEKCEFFSIEAFKQGDKNYHKKMGKLIAEIGKRN